MNRELFLKELSNHLDGIAQQEKDDIISYYEELIADAVDAGQKEEDFITKLGDMDSIVKKIELERKVKKLNDKPTAHNFMIAVIAVLGILATPIVIPMSIVIVTLIIVLFVLGISLVITFGAAAISSLVIFFASFTLFASTPYAIIFALLAMGLTILFTGLTLVTIKFVFGTIPVTLVNQIKKITLKKGGRQNV